MYSLFDFTKHQLETLDKIGAVTLGRGKKVFTLKVGANDNGGVWVDLRENGHGFDTLLVGCHSEYDFERAFSRAAARLASLRTKKAAAIIADVVALLTAFYK